MTIIKMNVFLHGYFLKFTICKWDRKNTNTILVNWTEISQQKSGPARTLSVGESLACSNFNEEQSLAWF